MKRKAYKRRIFDGEKRFFLFFLYPVCKKN